MAGWLHGVFVVDWLFVFPLCGFSLSLFCNYPGIKLDAEPCFGCLQARLRRMRAGKQCNKQRARRAVAWFVRTQPLHAVAAFNRSYTL